MRRRRLTPPAALTCLALSAARVSGQTLPVPALPAVHEPSTPRPWEYTLGGGLIWDGNIDFAVPDGPSGTAVAPRAGVARSLRGPRGQLQARAGGELNAYPGRDTRRYSADLGLEGTYRQSARTDWRGSAFYGLGYSDSSQILLDQGVSLPVMRVRWMAATAGVTRKAGQRTSIRVDGRYYGADFDAPEVIDGDSLRGVVALRRQIDPRSDAIVEYSVERASSGAAGPAYLTHYGSIQWSHLLSARSAFLLEGGGSFTPEAARAGLERKGSFFGGASYRRNVKRSSLTVFLRREVTPAFGIGVSRQELRAGLGSTVPLGRDWELQAAAVHVRPQAGPGAQNAYGSSDDAVATLIRRLGPRLVLSGEARYRRRGAMGTLPLVESFQAGLFVTIPTASGAALTPAR